MNTYRAIYGDQLTEKPKKQIEQQQSGYNSHLGWVFVCNKFEEKPKAVRTYHSLFGASKAYTYYTPNTFYRNDRRDTGALRWINAMVVDFDVKNGQNKDMTFPDVMDLITQAGLPEPSLVVSTPSRGFHIYWYLNSPKRAWPKVIEHYKRIQETISEVLKGDPQAVGAERWFRMPTESNTVYQSNSRVSFDNLCNWLQIHQETCQEERKAVCINGEGLMYHPAIKKLLEGVCEGQRDNTCYTLALTFKSQGYTEKETEERLYKWNENNNPSMRKIDIKRKVKSAFKVGAPVGPSATWIRRLSGMAFTYVTWEAAKPREERTYSHLDEWKDDVLNYLKVQGGEVVGSQRKIASAIKSSSDGAKSIPYSTFKKVIEHLINIGLLSKSVEGKGRAAITTIKLVNQSKIVMFPKKKKNNGFNSNTFIVPVVGGNSFSFYKSERTLFRSPPIP